MICLSFNHKEDIRWVLNRWFDHSLCKKIVLPCIKTCKMWMFLKDFHWYCRINTKETILWKLKGYKLRQHILMQNVFIGYGFYRLCTNIFGVHEFQNSKKEFFICKTFHLINITTIVHVSKHRKKYIKNLKCIFICLLYSHL